MMWREALLGLICLGAAEAAVASPQKAFDLERLKLDVATLSSDDFGGRLPGTPGEAKTIEYLIASMRGAGLKPGYHGRWVQNVPLVTLTPAPDTILHFHGSSVSLDVTEGRDAILWTKIPQPSVTLAASQLVFVGYGIDAPERGWNDYAHVDVRGKTVVILVNDPDWQAGDEKGPFDGRRLTYYGRYTYKFEEAARHGASAALIVHETAAAGYPFQVLINTSAGPKIDIDTPEAPTAHARIEGWLTTDAAARLFALAGRSLPELEKAAQKPGFRAVPLPLDASTVIVNTISHSVSHNVVGVLPGRTKPDEVFLYSAHWDHLGNCAPVAGHAICNGAIDNATGTAGLLAMARSFGHSLRPEHSILFLALTGEEQGMLGSGYYVAHPAVPIARTLGGINIDVMNMFGPTHDVMILHPGLSSLEPIFTVAARAQGRSLSPEMAPEQGLYYRSDQLNFARAGVPMLFASSGFDYLSPPADHGLPGYFQHVYHTARDVYDPHWNWDGAVADLDLYRTVGLTVANSDAPPSWDVGAEFRRGRDRSQVIALQEGARP